MRKVKSVDVLTAGQGINAGLVALSRNVGMVWVMRVVGPRREVDGGSNDASRRDCHPGTLTAKTPLGRR